MRWGLAMITDRTPYRQYVDTFDLTEEQKLELVNAIWVMLENYFDQQLGINQLALKAKRHQKSIDSELHLAILSKDPQDIELLGLLWKKPCRKPLFIAGYHRRNR